MGIVLTYFPIMGAAERVRLALWLGEIDFEDVRIPQVEWAALKGQTPFGQLPVMSIDGGPYIAQSNAMQCSNILEHLLQSYALHISF